MPPPSQRLLLALAVAATCAACIPGPVGQGQTAEPFRDVSVVEYYVQCRGCRVEYWTPAGLGWIDDVEGEYRRALSFPEPDLPSMISLVARPPDDDYVILARIRVNGRTVAQGGRNVERLLSGGPVRLTTCVGRVAPRAACGEG